jgi:hypothetical protein
MKKVFVTLLVLFTYMLASAQPYTSDSSKRGYTIFNPTPKNKMRGMQTDRPDVTESAFSVDAGHFQMEGDAYRLVLNNAEGVKTRESFYNLANLKVGLTNSIDLQLVIPFYQQEKVTTTTGHFAKRNSGFSDFTLRLKKNIWGNDKGRTAFSVMPFLSFQTGKHVADRRPEGGIVVPFSAELTDIWSIGAQGQISLLRNETRKYDTELLNSVTIGKALSSNSSAFVESYYTYNLNLRKFECFLNGGVVYSFTENFKADIGISYGLTKGSDHTYFIGYSFRY